MGGGHAFAKRPKDWSYRLPEKAVKAATRMAILSKIQDGQLVVVDSLDFAEPKTKVAVSVLAALGANRGGLVATEVYDVNTWKSFRNVVGVSVSPVLELNARDVLLRRQLVVTQAAMDKLRQA